MKSFIPGRIYVFFKAFQDDDSIDLLSILEQTISQPWLDNRGRMSVLFGAYSSTWFCIFDSGSPVECVLSMAFEQLIAEQRLKLCPNCTISMDS